MFPWHELEPATAIGPNGLPLPARIACAPKPMNARDSSAGPESIQSLTRAMARGDADAFGRFHDRFSFRIYKYLLVLARGDELDAREVCQTVFIKLARRCRTFDDEVRLWSWLCVVARNVFIDHCRARQRGRLVSCDQLPDAISATASDDPLSELLRESIAALSPEERELIQAVYVDRRPIQELADESGQTYKAVESRLARLRLKLKEHLLGNLRHENQS
jgi:RNA polymerase sigma-70 factor (ECF subfamily)